MAEETKEEGRKIGTGGRDMDRRAVMENYISQLIPKFLDRMAGVFIEIEILQGDYIWRRKDHHGEESEKRNI